MKIILVEDNPEYRNVLGELLEHDGHRVMTATDGIEAFDLLQRFPADLIISDINMPNSMGTQLHEKVRSNEQLKRIPFIYITGYTILRLSTPLRNTGLDFMVNKTQFEKLLHVVNDLSRTKGSLTTDPVMMNAA